MMQIENMACSENSETPSPSMVAKSTAIVTAFAHPQIEIFQLPFGSQTNTELAPFSIWANNKTGLDFRDSVNHYGPISPNLHRPLQNTASLGDAKRANQWLYQQQATQGKTIIFCARPV
jgi:hypothetical protein